MWFESWARRWTRVNLGQHATSVGRWWGNALNEYRASGERTTEEIDIVGTARSKVTVVGEAKWRSGKMGADVVAELDKYKIPALVQGGFTLSPGLKVVLLSKGGYAASLRSAAESDRRLVLVDVAAELAR